MSSKAGYEHVATDLEQDKHPAEHEGYGLGTLLHEHSGAYACNRSEGEFIVADAGLGRWRCLGRLEAWRCLTRLRKWRGGDRRIGCWDYFTGAE